MLLFALLGKKGRLGNQLFQIASTVGIALKTGHEFVFPKWVYSKYFEFDLTPSSQHGTQVQEPTFHYNKQFVKDISTYSNENKIDLNGYFQSEKYFEECAVRIAELFKFKKDFSDSVKNKYKEFFKNKKELIAISIRRGDYVNNPNYYQIPITWYYTALEKNFPNWKKENNVVIFSDDIKYCKLHFGNFENVYYAENNFNNNDKSKYLLENPSAIEQLCLMTYCTHFIISNSTFAWWGAWLGERSWSKIIVPVYHFNGNLLKNNDAKDYYPERWIRHEDEKIDLSDVTFMIPVSYDHNDRKENLSLNVCMLQKNFNTNIIVTEQGSNEFDNYRHYNCVYKKFDYEHFHRTKMLNEMALMAKTPIIVNWDADVFISPLQILYSIEKIRSGESDVVYPYDGRFARVPRKPSFKMLEQSLDIGIMAGINFSGMSKVDKLSVGGAIIFSKEKFLEGGGENENFIAYGPEDVEREVRFVRLGYNVFRTPGVLYHIDHFKGPNSKCAGNKFDKQNHDELEKIYSLSQEELRNYVSTFKWKK